MKEPKWSDKYLEKLSKIAMKSKFSTSVSKWVIHTDCTQNLAQDIKSWFSGNFGPKVYSSKRKNPVKLKETKKNA